MNEKIDRINKYNDEVEDASKYTKKIKSESYTFLDEEDLENNINLNSNNFNSNNNNRLSYNDFYVGKKIYNNKEKIRKTKGMSVAEFNNKRFDKRPRTGKSYNGKNSNNKMNQKYFNEYLKKNEELYNLEKERNNLINFKNDKDNPKNANGASNIVEQFFLRQFSDNENNLV